ncbi:patatin-like phospholipase family protein [Camelliibacillus cellulosilyticus]|uniref:Patatin-like phospholipase family protein n=1 Tax=Camelliibacillus cellulosilyticus TaxID=2174486 RepID=A0ABV9GJ32_9BACL
MARPLIGLALGSGGIKGFAHIGVLKVLDESGIPIDFMAGSSIGALAAALYGAGHDWESMKKMANAFGRRHYLDFALQKMGLVRGQRAAGLIKALTHNKKFSDSRVPITMVATDLLTGKRVLLDTGYLYEAVRASISIPGIFVPVQMGDMMLVDGGVVDRVPASVVREMGADIVIAVDVAGLPPQPRIRSIFDVILQSIDIMQEQLVGLQGTSADILLKPQVVQYNTYSSTRIDKIIKIGEREAERHLSEIQRLVTIGKERS